MFNPRNFHPGEYETKGPDGEMVKPGQYICWIRGHKYKSSQRGDDQILLIIQPLFYVKSGIVEINNAAPIFELITLTETAAWKLADICKTVGQSSPFDALDDYQLSEALEWKPFKASIKHTTYNGNTRAQLDKFLPMSDAEKTRVKQFAEDYDYSEKNDSNTGNGKSGPGYDDEIPF